MIDSGKQSIKSKSFGANFHYHSNNIDCIDVTFTIHISKRSNLDRFSIIKIYKHFNGKKYCIDIQLSSEQIEIEVVKSTQRDAKDFRH